MEIARIFEDVPSFSFQKLQTEFGSSGVNLRSRLETIEKSYYFINFGRRG